MTRSARSQRVVARDGSRWPVLLVPKRKQLVEQPIKVHIRKTPDDAGEFQNMILHHNQPPFENVKRTSADRSTPNKAHAASWRSWRDVGAGWRG